MTYDIIPERYASIPVPYALGRAMIMLTGWVNIPYQDGIKCGPCATPYQVSHLKNF